MAIGWRSLAIFFFLLLLPHKIQLMWYTVNCYECNENLNYLTSVAFKKQSKTEDTNNRYSLLMPLTLFKMLEVNDLIFSLQELHEGYSLLYLKKLKMQWSKSLDKTSAIKGVTDILAPVLFRYTWMDRPYICVPVHGTEIYVELLNCALPLAFMSNGGGVHFSHRQTWFPFLCYFCKVSDWRCDPYGLLSPLL